MRGWNAVLMAGIALLAPSSLSAQGVETGDVAVAYSHLQLTDADEGSLPAGWLVAGARRYGLLTVAGEVAGNYQPYSGEGLTIHTFMGGLRFSPVRTGVRPVGQVLAGAASVSRGSRQATYFTIEPGAGVEIPVGSRAAARVGLSMPIIMDEECPAALFRLQVGAVFRMGGR